MTILTIDQVVDTFSEGLDSDKRRANREWLVRIYNRLNDGGVLAIPNTEQIFIKKRWGFIITKQF